MNRLQTTRFLIKPTVFFAGLLPLSWLVWGAVTDHLGANPVEAITHTSGHWALRFLLLTLLITPLRRLSGWHELLRLRRMLGLYAFFYALLHFLTYAWLDQLFNLGDIGEDILKRPYITLGFSAFLLLVPLAITSTRGMQRRLGGRRWQRLHRLVYVAATLAVLHFLWLVKADYLDPLLYATTFLLLMLARTRPTRN